MSLLKRFRALKRDNSEKEASFNEQLKREGGLEKGDFSAMVVSALIVFLPICLILLLLMCFIVFLL